MTKQKLTRTSLATKLALVLQHYTLTDITNTVQASEHPYNTEEVLAGDYNVYLLERREDSVIYHDLEGVQMAAANPSYLIGIVYRNTVELLEDYYEELRDSRTDPEAKAFANRATYSERFID